MPGMNRNDVETSLRLKNLQFSSRCCYGDDRSYADLVKIGTEEPPWFCNEVNVYVVFQFVSSSPNLSLTPNPTDMLKRLALQEQPEVCL